ncbi:hypothetical protein BHE74_00034305 [Ensete ventricosum]|nr:hypothetical protein BHE74_00034305 [Ensete ventricosum]RZS02166.1 hypothetical protein BHM03_00032142 [Ensete ventricosum]
MGACREFARDRPRFGRCCRELTENSPEVCREVRREFVDRLWELGCSLEVYLVFVEGNRELVGGSSERCWEFAEETIGQ